MDVSGSHRLIDACALTVFLLCGLALVYIYHGYLVLLRFLARRQRNFTGQPQAITEPPFVTILLTVHNEAPRIASRLENILALDYPRERMEVLVASDGSTDDTDATVRAFEAAANVRLLRLPRGGKSAAQNAAVAAARGEILAFTDAEAHFATSYLKELVAPFADPRVGCVTAHLQPRQSGNPIASSQGYYWRYELLLREHESQLEILAVASGQAMAVRRECFVALPADVGEDCMIPLDTVLQGHLVVHQRRAEAWDVMVHDGRGEFRARARMTLRNWNGTWRRAALLNPLRFPGYALALWSHKVLRWLSPIFLALATVAILWLSRLPQFLPLGILCAVFYALGILGWNQNARKIRVPGTDVIFSFLLANAGFAFGLWLALTGRAIVSYPNQASDTGAP